MNWTFIKWKWVEIFSLSTVDIYTAKYICFQLNIIYIDTDIFNKPVSFLPKRSTPLSPEEIHRFYKCSVKVSWTIRLECNNFNGCVNTRFTFLSKLQAFISLLKAGRLHIWFTSAFTIKLHAIVLVMIWWLN